MAGLPGLLCHLRADDNGEAASAERDADAPVADERITGAARHRAAPLAVAVSAATALVVVLLLLAFRPPPPAGPGPWIVTSGNSATGLAASATLTAEATGTVLDLHVHGLPAGLTCELVAHTRDTSPQTAAWWTATGSTEASVPGTVSVAPYDITRIDVVTTQGQVLLSLPGS